MNMRVAVKMRYFSPTASIRTYHDTLITLAKVNLSEFQIITSSQQIAIRTSLPQLILKQSCWAKYGTIVAVIVIPVLVLLVSAIAVRFSRLRSVPGPFWAAYSRVWLVRALASGESAKVFVDVNKPYGE